MKCKPMNSPSETFSAVPSKLSQCVGAALPHPLGADEAGLSSVPRRVPSGSSGRHPLLLLPKSSLYWA